MIQNTNPSMLLNWTMDNLPLNQNNRVIFTDQSLVHPEKKIPDFKVCTQNYTVENTPKWSVGHTDEWSYKTKEEESNSD